MTALFGFIPWDDSKGVFENIGGGIADNTVEKIPGWDDSKGVFENIGGGIADNTVEKIPGWDDSKGVTDNIVGGVKDGVDSAVKAVQDVARGPLDALKKYWYVPVIIGGVIIGYKLLTKPNPQLMAALSKIRMPE